MSGTEDVSSEWSGLFQVAINGTVVPAFDQDGRRWYLLSTLFKALEFPEMGLNGIPTKIGSQFGDSGEFLKYKDTWFGTAEGLSLYADSLTESQYWPFFSSQIKQVALIRQRILKQWLSSLSVAPPAPEEGTASQPTTGEGVGDAPPGNVGGQSDRDDVSASGLTSQQRREQLLTAAQPFMRNPDLIHIWLESAAWRTDIIGKYLGLPSSLDQSDVLIMALFIVVSDPNRKIRLEDWNKLMCGYVEERVGNPDDKLEKDLFFLRMRALLWTGGDEMYLRDLLCNVIMVRVA